MDDNSPMQINKITPSVDLDYWLKTVDTANKDLIKVSKVLSNVCTALGTTIIYSPLFPPSLSKPNTCIQKSKQIQNF